MTLNYRKATMEDKEAVLSLKTQWSDDDYIHWVYDEWVGHEGGLYLVEDEGRLAGFAAITMVKEKEVWLHAMRVGIDFEGRGIGTTFTLFQLEEAKRLGAKVARLITYIDNHPIHHMVGEKLGFTRAGDWYAYWQVPVESVLDTELTGTIREVSLDEVEAIWEFLASQGRITHLAEKDSPWTVHSFGIEDLKEGIAKGLLHIWERGEEKAVVLHHGIDWTKQKALMIRSIAGSPEGMGELVSMLLKEPYGEAEEFSAGMFMEEASRFGAALDIDKEKLIHLVLYEIELG